MRREQLELAGRPATVFVGGAGTPVVLLHGGWGGAELHWSRVWDRIAERAFVLAPELPGVGDRQPGLGAIGDYADWVEALLAAKGIEAAVVVGNSFGAAIASALATRAPSRVRSLVLVNGTPFPRTPRIFVRAAAWRPTRALMKAVFRYNSFSQRALHQAFVHPEQLPPELRATCVGEPPQMDALLAALVHGGDGRLPTARTLLLFGDADRFPPTKPAAARNLHAKIPGAQLAFIPHAGHLPQLENPEAFLGALLPFLPSQATAPSSEFPSGPT